jgi:hypothetical protein
VTGSGDFLTTCAGAGATLVAIFGGFLITRYLTLSAEIESAKNVLEDLGSRIRVETRDLEKAEDELLDWDLDWEFNRLTFVRALIRGAISKGLSGFTLLDVRAVLNVGRFDSERLQIELDSWIAEIRVVAASSVWASIPGARTYPTWEEFRESHGLTPKHELLWEEWYERICKERNTDYMSGVNAALQQSVVPLSRGNYQQQRDPYERRRDVAREALDNALTEQVLAERQSDRLSSPEGVMMGLGVLVVVFGLTVVPSVLLLAPAPAHLSRTGAAEVAIGFFAGVGLLFGYLLRFARRLGKGTAASERPRAP